MSNANGDWYRLAASNARSGECMAQDDRKLSPNAYLKLAEEMRARAERASSEETRGEFARLAAMYEKLAVRGIRGPMPSRMLRR